MIERILDEVMRLVEKHKKKQMKFKERVKILRSLKYRDLVRIARDYNIPTKKEERYVEEGKDGFPVFKTRHVYMSYDELVDKLARKLYDEQFEIIKKRFGKNDK